MTLFKIFAQKPLFAFVLLLTFEHSHAGGGNTVGNGGNTINFSNYVFDTQATAPLGGEFSFKVQPRPLLSSGLMKERKENCLSFFRAAAKAWRSIAFDNVLSLTQDQLLLLKSSQPRRELLQLWDKFTLSDVDALCSEAHYLEADEIIDSAGKTYIAINNSDEQKITLNPKSLDSSAAFVCTAQLPFNSLQVECEDAFRESIALHEVLSMFFPQTENHFSYLYSSHYFYRASRPSSSLEK